MLRAALVLFALLLAGSSAMADVNVKTCAPEPEVTPIAYGDLVNCEITPLADSDLYRFTGQAGDQIYIYLMRYGGNANQCFRLIQPDGTFGSYTCTSSNSFGARNASVWAASALTQSGTFTIQVIDGNSDETMNYGLHLYRYLPLPSYTKPIFGGAVLNGDVSPRGDVDFFTFSAPANTTISVTLTRLNGNANQCFTLRDSSGESILSACAPSNSFGARNASVGRDFKLTQTGTYALLIEDGNVDETFSYNLSLECFGGECVPSGPSPICPETPTFLLSPQNQILPATAATGSIGVFTSPGCSWSVTSDASFLTFTSGAGGSGPGAVQFSLPANSSAAPRTASITVANQRATLTQSGSAPLLIVSPSPLAHTVPEGSAEVSEQLLSVFTNSASLAFTAAAATNSGGDWLSVSTRSGAAPASLVASINPSNVPVGVHTGTITVSAPNANPSARVIPVTLRIQSAGPPKLAVEAGALVLSFAEGAPPRVERRRVSNLGGGKVEFEATAATLTGEGWLRVTPDRGEASLTSAASLAVTVDPTRLAPGTYSGRITVKSGDESLGVPVTVAVSSVQQSILVSQSGLSFTAVRSGGAAPPQTFGVLNTGSGFMEWSATVSSKGNWLSITPAAGLTDAASLEVPTVEVAVNAEGLAPGEYYGQVKIEAPRADNSPQFVSVVLTVLPPGSDPGPLVRPTGLIFTGVSGGASPAAQTVRVSNLTSTARTFASGRLSIDGQTWFTSQPAGATVRPGQPVDVQVQVNAAGLGPGIRRGVLTLLFQDGSIANVNILLVLIGSASSGPAISGRRLAEGCTPTSLLPVISSLGTNFTVPAGWPTTIEARIVDDCGDPLVDGSVVATFSNGDPPVPLVSLKNGRWIRTWVPRQTDVSQVTVTISAEAPGKGIEGSTQLTGALRANPEPPLVRSGGIVSAISFQGEPLAPGAMVTIFGSKLKSGPGELVAVIGGKPMPLVGDPTENQVNAIVPYGLPVNTRHQLIIQRGDAYTNPESVTVAAAAPAIHTKNASGKGQGAILGSDGAIYEPGNAARAGSELIIYCSGLGEVNPRAEAGKAAPDSPANTPVAEIVATIGGIRATVSEARLAPGLVGIYIVRAVVPEGVEPGDAVPVVLTVAGQSSPPVTMAVE